MPTPLDRAMNSKVYRSIIAKLLRKMTNSLPELISGYEYHPRKQENNKKKT